MRLRLHMDPTPAAKRRLLHWLQPAFDWAETEILLLLILQGVSYALFFGARHQPSASSIPWTISGVVLSQAGFAFWVGVRYAERRSRRITQDCDIFVERVTELLNKMSDEGVIAPGENAVYVRDVSDVEH